MRRLGRYPKRKNEYIYFAKTTVSSNVTTGFAVLEGENPAWKIFPNPASAQLQISVPQKLIGQESSVYNANGKKISTTKIYGWLTTIDTRTLPSGTYYLRIGNEARQFVVQ